MKFKDVKVGMRVQAGEYVGEMAEGFVRPFDFGFVIDARVNEVEVEWDNPLELEDGSGKIWFIEHAYIEEVKTRVPSRVRIIANKEGAYYDKFIDTEHDVVDSDGTEITLQIMDDTGKETHTFWYDGEYEVLEWDDAENKVEQEIETVTIGKAEYDELLEFWKCYHVVEE